MVKVEKRPASAERPGLGGPRPESAAALDTARGGLREGVSALRNLLRLLGSPVIGPRQLLELLPELEANCRAIASNSALLLAGTRERAPLTERTAAAVAELVEHQVERITAALREATPSRLKARERLTLEEVARGCLEKLDAARGLVELLDEAAWGLATPVELRDAVRGAFVLKDRGSRPPAVVPVVLTPTANRIELSLNPRLAARLVPLAVASLEGGVTAPRITLSTLGERALLDVERSAIAGEELLLGAPTLIEPSLAAAMTAARLVGAELTLTPGRDRARLAFPLS